MDAAAAVLPTHWGSALKLPVLNAPASLAQLPETLQIHAQRRRELANAGTALVQRWREVFPKGVLAFGLVQLGGESNTLLRWRCSGQNCRPRGRRSELTDVADSLPALPASVRTRILEFEQQRITLNFEYALATYVHARLLDLERHRTALAQLRRLSGTPKPAPARRI